MKLKYSLNIMPKNTTLLCLFVVCFGVVTPGYAIDILKASTGESVLDQRVNFKNEILASAMEATRETHGDFEIKPAKHHLNAKRALEEIIRNGAINVYFAHSRQDWEDGAITIRIPIRRGLSSYRLLIIHKDAQHLFDQINTIEDLKKLRVGLNDSWATYTLLRAQGFGLAKVEDYDGMFTMLSNRRFDYLVRGVNEVYGEFSVHNDAESDLIIEPRLALHIPSATYLYVSKHTPELAKRLEIGLRLMIENGKLKEVFDKYYTESLRSASLRTRKIIYVPNLPMEEGLQLNDNSLWPDLRLSQKP